MEHTCLKNAGFKIPALSLGTWAFSGVKLWGENDERESIEAVHCALDLGINLFDTAERYGAGRAEEVLGKALLGRRDKALIATKAYMGALAYGDMITHCEESLRRLQTDYVDLYLIHWPNPEIPVEETFRAFDKLRADGKIRAAGVCNGGPGFLKSISGYQVAIDQLPYSLIWRQIEKTAIPQAQADGIPVWAYSPLAQGLLTGKFRTLEDVPMNRRETRFYSSKWKQGRHSDPGFETEIFALLPKLQKLADENGFSMASLALAFLKSRPAVGSVLVGARNARQLGQNFESYEAPVPADLVAEIVALSEPLREAMGTNADLWESKDGGRMF